MSKHSREMADSTFRSMLSHILIALILFIVGATEIILEPGITNKIQGVALILASLLGLYVAYQFYSQWRIYSWDSI